MVCKQAEVIMRRALEDEHGSDGCIAAQCLAYYGECDSVIVKHLISQLFASENTLEQERLIQLLRALSENSVPLFFYLVLI